jgi:hypothetical protein
MTTQPSPPELACKACGKPKAQGQIVCNKCFNRLPPDFRRSLTVIKLQALNWLREHPELSNTIK